MLSVYEWQWQAYVINRLAPRGAFRVSVGGIYDGEKDEVDVHVRVLTVKNNDPIWRIYNVSDPNNSKDIEKEIIDDLDSIGAREEIMRWLDENFSPEERVSATIKDAAARLLGKAPLTVTANRV